MLQTITSLGTRTTSAYAHHCNHIACQSAWHVLDTPSLCALMNDCLTKILLPTHAENPLVWLSLQAEGWTFAVALRGDTEYVKLSPRDIHAQCPS